MYIHSAETNNPYSNKMLMAYNSEDTTTSSRQEHAIKMYVRRFRPRVTVERCGICISNSRSFLFDLILILFCYYGVVYIKAEAIEYLNFALKICVAFMWLIYSDDMNLEMLISSSLGGR